MDLLKFLRKEKTGSFENLLKKAADKPAYRVELYKRILNEKLIVLTQQTGMFEGMHKTQEDTTVKILTFDGGTIPVFTSTDRIFDNGIVKTQIPFLEMRGEDILKMVKGVKFIINPYSDYGKELLPEEIEAVLDGTYISGKVQQIKYEKETTVQIGQPANYPTDIVKSLSQLFSQKPDVNAAYVAWIHNPDIEEPAHYIFAIDAGGNWSSISNEAGYVVQQILGPDQIVDFMKLGDGGINDYFKSIVPFYQK
jgi:hypothetical protein